MCFVISYLGLEKTAQHHRRQPTHSLGGLSLCHGYEAVANPAEKPCCDGGCFWAKKEEFLLDGAKAPIDFVQGVGDPAGVLMYLVSVR